MDARVGWRSDEAGAAPRVRIRMLPGEPGAPGLEFVEAEPDFAPTGAPVLFVHGAFAGAWMWREVFMPFFARRGRACAAVSLRGQAERGRAGLRAARLSDCRDDLQRAFAALPEPPVVVAHSLGGLLAQQLIGREEMRALALLASLPPEGLWLESPRLAITDPHIWLEAVAGSARRRPAPDRHGGARGAVLRRAAARARARYAALMTPELPRALADAHVPGPIVSASVLAGVPTLVLGGTR